LADGGVEDGPAEVAGTEVELLPEPLDLGDVVLAVLAEDGAVGVDHGRGVVVVPRLLDLEHRYDEHHAGLPGKLPHPAGGRAVGDGLGPAVVVGVLDLAEVGGVEHLLEPDDLRAPPGRLAGVRLVFRQHGLGVTGTGRLDQSGTYDMGHELLLGRGVSASTPVERGRRGSNVSLSGGLAKTIAVEAAESIVIDTPVGEPAGAPVLAQAANPTTRSACISSRCRVSETARAAA